MIVLAWAVTVALLLLVPVMVWRCWNLPPVPLQRIWALGFGAASWACLAAHWRAELWRKRYLELEGRIQQSVSTTQLLRLRLPKTRLVCADDQPFRLCAETESPVLITRYDFGRQLLAVDPSKTAAWSKDNARIALASDPQDFCIWADQFCVSLSKAEPGLWTSLYFSELHLGNREPILTASWQSETLIKRLWMRSRQRPNLSRSKAKNFWNPKSLSASYARPKNGSIPSLKPFGKQPVEKAGEIPFPLLSPFSVFLSEGDGIGGLALWLPASAFSFSASTLHLKKYVFFLLICFET